MKTTFQNVDINPIHIKHNNHTVKLEPNETIDLETNEEGFIEIGLVHDTKDKFNPIWYSLNEIFTLEQMRTVLVTDGVYIIKPWEEGTIVKIKSYEYVFHKDTSYDTFVFNVNSYDLQRKKLYVPNETKIIKRSKFLYLFGGQKTFLPLMCILLVSMLIKIALSSIIPDWAIIVTVFSAISVVVLFFKYLNCLKFLKRVIKEREILDYMQSSRPQYRNFSDNLVQHHLDRNSKNEIYY